MNTGFATQNPGLAPPVWPVGALVQAVGRLLEARFSPVAVRGEISGFARAASGHCYFALKDQAGQLRCAMFRRAASLLDFEPGEGDQVEVRGRVSVYEPRGDLQLVVESMARAGQGALFEQFLRLKARLEREGLFDAARKRPLPAMPRGIGIVTSLGAAALHDVLSTLVRRVPHIPVLVVPAAVQGVTAPAELAQALQKLYQRAPSGRARASDSGRELADSPIDLILLVRGGGSIQDLWAFNDERLARTIARSPVPVISGVGHETDFTIADFVADVRAPTPTGAAELASQPRAQWLGELDARGERLQRALHRRLDAEAQRIDRLVARLGRPSGAVAAERLRLAGAGQRLRHALAWGLDQERARLQRLGERLPAALAARIDAARQRLERAALGLSLLDPRLVLERGYAWLEDEAGRPVTRAAQTALDQPLAATLADGRVDVRVTARHLR